MFTRLAVAGGAAGFGYTQLLPNDAKAVFFPAHAWLADAATAALRQIDAETAHNIAITAAKYNLTPVAPKPDDLLRTQVCGLGFGSPVGLAAGFDKNADAVDGLFGLGFGFVEIGTVTPLPQPGNEKPRMWRLTEDCGVINRYGFNSEGMAEVSRRLEKVAEKDRPIGVNVGKNKLTPEDEAAEDYSKGIRKLGSKADYIVINVSSPNTPGLRNLQKKDLLQALLKKVVTVRNELGHRPPLLVKVAPDLDAQELKDVAEASLAAAVDGIIVSNTTIARPETLRSENKAMQGGLSGRPLRARATKAVHDMSLATDQKLPIVGVGGIANGQDAFDKIVVGASLVQLYSMMAFEGPSIGHRVNTELADLLRLHGFKSVKEAVGAAHRNPELMPSDLRGA